MSGLAIKMQVGLGSQILSTKQVHENKQPSVEVHSVVWPPSERCVCVNYGTLGNTEIILCVMQRCMRLFVRENMKYEKLLSYLICCKLGDVAIANVESDVACRRPGR